jgi:hypothetical protein
MFEIIIIALLAGSLDNLENEVGTEIGYRIQLIKYVVLHNMTLPPTINQWSIDIHDFEGIVKEHMADCKSGIHDSLVSQFNNNSKMDEKMKKELLGQLGNC